MPKYPNHAKRADAVCGSPLEVMAPKIAELRAEGRLYPFQLGDSCLMPAEAARRIDLDRDEMHRYCPVPGLPAYRQAVADWVGPQLGVELTSTNVIAAVGCTGAIAAAATSLFDPGDEVLVITPTWPVILGILKTQNLVPIEVPISDSGWPEDDVETFRRRLVSLLTEKTAGIYFSDPNNPGGFVMPPDHMDVLQEVAADRGLWVMVDVVYKDLILDQSRWYTPQLLQNSATAGQTFLAGSFSKSHAMAGHRAGFLIGPADLKRIVTRVVTHQPYHASTSAQAMGIAALTAGKAEIERVRRSYAEGMEAAHSSIKARCKKPSAGAFLFLDLREFVDDEAGLMDLLMACLEVGVALAPGDIFGADFIRFARLCYTRTPPSVVSKGVGALNTVIA